MNATMITILQGLANDINEELATAKAARFSRTGARAGRLVRMVRLIRLVRIVKLYKYVLRFRYVNPNLLYSPLLHS